VNQTSKAEGQGAEFSTTPCFRSRTGQDGSCLDYHEFNFTDRDFVHICHLVREYSGIHLTDIKRELVYSRISRRLRALGLKDFSSYCQRLGQGDEVEKEAFINAITTNTTSFFREPHHFEYLADKLLPELTKQQARPRLRIWSAGCSAGQEPYCIAITLQESLSDEACQDVKILATDLDSNVLATARQGIYPLEQMQKVPKAQLRQWFLHGKGAQTDKVRLAPELREMISFNQLNLMHTWPMQGPFNIIFCRNVVIYFDKPTQRRLFDRYADMLTPDGHLFIGHSETLNQVSDRFELIGTTIYRKRA
jgi:chemotaxis protein methyltransferase CheR